MGVQCAPTQILRMKNYRLGNRTKTDTKMLTTLRGPIQRPLASMRDFACAFTFLTFALCCTNIPVWASGKSPISNARIHGMTCEYLVNPQGIDVVVPRLSWKESSPKPDYVQSAYRILVASNPTLLAKHIGNLWDSGKVISNRTTLIDYGGTLLKSRMACWWCVQVWDSHGSKSAWSHPATFTMGLLHRRDWKGEWIGKAATKPLVSLSLLQGSSWIWYPQSGAANASAPLGKRFFRTQIHLRNLGNVKRAVFVGTVDNQFSLYVNGRRIGGGSDWYQPLRFNLLPYLHTGENIIAIAARNIGTSPNPAGVIAAVKIAYRSGGLTVVHTGPSWVASEKAHTGWMSTQGRSSDWVAAQALGPDGMQPWGDLAQGDIAAHPPLSARYLRREFVVSHHVKKAVAYVCGLGFSYVFVNGLPASNHVMDPALSDYRKADYYVTLDVTKLLHPGANAIGVILGNGRFYPPRMTAVNYGLPRLLLQLEITYSNGSKQTIVSDRHWQVTDQGPIRANNEYDGESYDARMAIPGWSRPGYTPRAGIWEPASIMRAPGGRLEAQMIEPMRVTRVVHPVAISSPLKGIYEIDMGRTFYGTVRLIAGGHRGKTVTMTSAYSLLPDGLLKTADNRTARATDSYTFAGKGVEVWNPIFKGQGFRRVQVKGFPGKPSKSNFEGLVEHTDVKRVGSFSCSNSLINKIHNAMCATMKMFLRSAPLDPDRDERMPWMGDPAKDSESEAYNYDIAAFYTKWMDDVRRSQRPDGTIPDVSMYWQAGQGVEWPSVFTIIPDWYTLFYADTRLERRNYPAMKRWVLAMSRIHGRPDGTLTGLNDTATSDIYTIGGKISDFGMTPLDLVATAYQYNNVRIMQHAATRLGFHRDSAMWRLMGNNLYNAFLNRFFNATTCTFTSGTQCSYVLPLAFGLLPKSARLKQNIVNNLVHDILITHEGHLTVGLIGNQWLMQVLSKFGRSDVAWRIVTQTTRPSWGYMIAKGAQTIWERWDYDTRGPGMNSEALLIQAGNVDAWFYQTLAGIQTDPAHPGFAHIIIHPHILGNLKWVHCRFNSPHGLIVSNWTRNGNTVTMHITVPTNTTATVITPTGTRHELGSGTWTLNCKVSDDTSRLGRRLTHMLSPVIGEFARPIKL